MRYSVLLITSLTLLALMPFAVYPAKLTYVITGIKGHSLKNVQERLSIRQSKITNAMTSEQIQDFFEEAPYEIRKALQPYGFFETKIQSKLIRNSEQEWTAYYHIDTGKPLTITHIDLRLLGPGAHDKMWHKEIKQLPIKVGDPFSSPQYEKAKHYLLDTAFKHSYMGAKLSRHEVHINLKKKTVAILLYLDIGHHFHFGQVHFSKLSSFKDSFLHRFLKFKPGDLYDPTQLQVLQQDLTDSHFFQRVEVTPLLDYEDTLKTSQKKNPSSPNLRQYHVPIEVKLLPNKARQYIFGLGFGTDTGARGLTGIKFRHMGSNGQHLQTLVKASELETRLTGDYIIPGSNPVSDQYSIGIAFEDQHHRPGRSRSLKLVEGYTTTFKHWRQTFSINALYDSSSPKGEPKRTNFILYPKLDWLHAKSDDPIKPSKGDRIRFTLLGASRSAYSSINFIQARMETKWIRTLAHNHRFVLRGLLGYTDIKTLRKLPLDLSFYAGGTQSLRGYSYRSIGPGKQLITGSIEYQYRLWGHWYGTVFYDVGDASSSFTQKPKQGAGIGLLWLSNLGAIELTLAKALSRTNQPLLVQFSMGPEL